MDCEARPLFWSSDFWFHGDFEDQSKLVSAKFETDWKEDPTRCEGRLSEKIMGGSI